MSGIASVTAVVPCIKCKKTHAIAIKADDYERWQNGEHIQDVAPYLSDDQRELLISGICGPCFDAIFAEDDEDE